MVAISWKFECKACMLERDQAAEPELKYFQISPGKWASLECCKSCAQKADEDWKEEKRREAEKKAKGQTNATAAKAKKSTKKS